MKVVGYVSNWFDAKNFGFIHENKNGTLQSYFFHRKHLISGIPEPGKLTRFTPTSEAKGLVASDVEVFENVEELNRAEAVQALVDSMAKSGEVGRE
jgi:hypothetical protein